MKQLLLVLAAFFITLIPASANAFEDWSIDSFHSEITVNPDSTIEVTETIEVFFNLEKRGIFREIPVEYYDEFRQSKTIDLEVVSVTNEAGEPWEYTNTYDYGYRVIRIGNPNIYLTGPQTYNITYTVDRALGYYDDHDELYWDVTGNDWFVPIKNTSATVTVTNPDEIDLATKARCFTGEFGSTEEDCEIEQVGNTINYSANDFLTIVAGWNKGLVAEPTAWDKFVLFAKNNYGYILPFIAFAIMFHLWRKHGKDPEDAPGLVTQFDPPEDLTPVEVGYLVHQKMRKRDMSAELVNLASKGFLQIKELPSKKAFKEDDYMLIKKKSFDDSELKPHEQAILKGIFLSKEERKVSEIPRSFHGKLASIKKDVFAELKKKKYFEKDPQVVKTSYAVMGIFIMFGAFFTLGFQHIHFFIGILLSGVIVFLFSFIMPKRTQRGVEALEHALGFKRYIEIAEDRRVQWEEQKNLFFEYLPYAMVFGVAEKWARAFKDVFNDVPDWYQGDGAPLNTTKFIHMLDNFESTTSSHIRPPQSSGSGYRSSSSSFSSSSFSGGGFSGGSSGGGFGGGGGGSW